MSELTLSPYSSYFSQLPVSAIVFNSMLAQRLSEHSLVRVMQKVLSVLSHSLTLILLSISVFGFYELTSLYASSHNPAHSTVLTASAIPKPVVKAPVGLPRSAPTNLSIPGINVDSPVVGVGLDSNGALEVPGPTETGWYNLGPSPGEVGPAVIVGHVDYVTVGAAVFWNLKDMQPDDKIQVTREDGRTVNFTVQKVESYEQGNFPTQAVYGNIDYPGLRLITCDGNFNYLTHHYSHDLVVYAKADL